MTTVLLSIISSTVVSAIISGLVTYYLKGLEFRNEYYKKIVDKRLNAYENIERLILLFQRVSIDDDNRTKYHWVFKDWQLLDEFRQALNDALFQSMWLSSKTLNLLLQLEAFFYRLDDAFPFDQNNDSVIAGKHYHSELEVLKASLEVSCKYDLLNLHKIKIFQHGKKSC